MYVYPFPVCKLCFNYFKTSTLEEKKNLKLPDPTNLKNVLSPKSDGIDLFGTWEPTFLTNTQCSDVSSPQITHTFGWATWGGIMLLPQLA